MVSKMDGGERGAALCTALRERTICPGGAAYGVVPYLWCRVLADRYSLGPRDVEIAALEGGICPSRYERNMGTFGVDGQLALLRACVAVVGLGGLGGLVVDLLARAGVGELILIDGDDFSDGNLNRQLLCRESDVGRKKAAVARECVAEVNAATTVRVFCSYVEEGNASELLTGAQVVVDALDNNAARAVVSRYCRRAGIPFVHGAIAGLWAQTAVFGPEERTPWEDEAGLPNRGVELETGNPPFTPAFAAALQVALVVETITGIAEVKRGVLNWCDLGDLSIRKLPL